MNHSNDSNKSFITTICCSKTTLEKNYALIDMHGGTSFLKWAGGKGQLISELDKVIPYKFNNYLEPFVGGGSLFFHIKKRYPNKKCIISDVNGELINSYNVIKYFLTDLIKQLEKYKKSYNKRGIIFYYKVRKYDPTTLSDIERAARFIFLNKTCWNGLYRVNSNGKFNVPAGKYRNPKIFDKKRLEEVNKVLNNTIIKKVDFTEILKFASRDDFIYFDPPYYPISSTSKFTDYNKSGFTKKDQEKLAEIFKKLDKKGCFLLLSNSDTGFIRELYNKFIIKSIDAKRSINCIGSRRGPVSELIIKNY